MIWSSTRDGGAPGAADDASALDDESNGPVAATVKAMVWSGTLVCILVLRADCDAGEGSMMTGEDDSPVVDKRSTATQTSTRYAVAACKPSHCASLSLLTLQSSLGVSLSTVLRDNGRNVCIPIVDGGLLPQWLESLVLLVLGIAVPKTCRLCRVWNDQNFNACQSTHARARANTRMHTNIQMHHQKLVT